MDILKVRNDLNHTLEKKEIVNGNNHATKASAEKDNKMMWEEITLNFSVDQY